LSGPVGEGTGVGEAGADGVATGGALGMLTDPGAPDSPDGPEHAARKAAKPANVDPCRKARRLMPRGSIRWSSTVSSRLLGRDPPVVSISLLLRSPPSTPAH
jgi:hypothetical protein